MNRREMLQASAISLLMANVGESSSAEEIGGVFPAENRYAHVLTASEMRRVEQTTGTVGAVSGGRELPHKSGLIIPYHFDRTKKEFIHSQYYEPTLDPRLTYRMKTNLKSIHLKDIPEDVKEDTLQVRTVASVGKEEAEDWLSWVIFTAVECVFNRSDSGNDPRSGLVGLGSSGSSPSVKTNEQAVVKAGVIQVCFELYGEKRKSLLFKILKALSTATSSPILSQVAFPFLVGTARNFILQAVQNMESNGTTRILTSPQGTYGVVKDTEETYKLGKGLWALMNVQDAKDLKFPTDYALDFDEMQYAIKTRKGDPVQANYMVVDLDFPQEKTGATSA